MLLANSTSRCLVPATCSTRSRSRPRCRSYRTLGPICSCKAQRRSMEMYNKRHCWRMLLALCNDSIARSWLTMYVAPCGGAIVSIDATESLTSHWDPSAIARNPVHAIVQYQVLTIFEFLVRTIAPKAIPLSCMSHNRRSTWHIDLRYCIL
jgi:hypothetical protein